MSGDEIRDLDPAVWPVWMAGRKYDRDGKLLRSREYPPCIGFELDRRVRWILESYGPYYWEARYFYPVPAGES